MSSRRRLTRPTALIAAVAVVMGIGGAASALGGVAISQTETLPTVEGSVELCVASLPCQTTPEPLAEGGALTVTATSSEGAATPTLTAGPAHDCPAGQAGRVIKVDPGAANASVSASVAGTGALSGANVATPPIQLNQDPGETQVFKACVKPVKVG